MHDVRWCVHWVFGTLVMKIETLFDVATELAMKY